MLKLVSILGMIVGIKTGFLLNVEELIIVNVVGYEILTRLFKAIDRLSE